MKNILTDIATLFVLALCGWVFTHHLGNFVDLSLWDEGVYLNNGTRLAENGLPDPSWGPLYACWYWLLHLGQPDQVRLHDLNHALMVVLPSLLLYTALRRWKVSLLASFLFAIFVMTVAFPVWPRVVHFAVMIILGGVIAASFAKRPVGAVYTLALTALLASYVRPEFFLVFILLVVIWSVTLLLSRSETIDTQAIGIVVLIAAFLFTHTVFGNPFGGDKNRSFAAFGQHYSQNWVYWNRNNPALPKDARDPWVNYKALLVEDFGDADSVGGALAANPSQFLRHIRTNIKNTPRVVRGVFGGRYPQDTFSSKVLLWCFAGLGVWGLIRYRVWVKECVKERWRISLCVALFAIPCIMSVCVVYPRPHYIYAGGMILLTAGVLLVFNQAGTPARSVALCWALAILLIRPVWPEHVRVQMPIREVVSFIRGMNIDSEAGLLESDGGYTYYLPDNFSYVPAHHKSFDRNGVKDYGWYEYGQSNNVNMILLSQRLLVDKRFADDPEWVDFMDNLEERGFKIIHQFSNGSQLAIYGAE